MTKIIFIGAGSPGFTRTPVRDLLTFPLLEDATLALMEIDPERPNLSKQVVEKIVRLGNHPAHEMLKQNQANLPQFKRFEV